MNNIFIKMVTKVLFLIFVLVGVFVLYLTFDYRGSCVSDGKVWDGDEQRCRDDCLMWDREWGCIKLNYEQIDNVRECRKSGNCDDKKLLKQICFYNNKAWQVDKKACDFEFKIEECYKLDGNWEYPLTCKKIKKMKNK